MTTARDLPRILTIGYGRRDPDDFVALLEQYDVDVLVDVRSAPYSRIAPDFTKHALERWLPARGVRYLFLGHAVGGMPDDPALQTDDGQADYERIRAAPAFNEAIARLVDADRQAVRVALMCAEARPETCHRTKLIAPALEAVGVTVGHIDETGVVQDHATIMRRLTGGQGTLFAD